LSGQFSGSGLRAFDLASEFIIGECLSQKPAPASDADVLTLIDNTYRKICHTHGSDFGHYFRHLYQVYRLLETSTITDKHRYAALIRANLSTSELTVLFYNCLSSLGIQKFKPLVEKYAAFEDMRDLNQLVAEHRRLFHGAAFGKSA
jgi:hypothetical protein